MNSDFINELCEAIYGDEFTKHDTKNILRNIKPAYEGSGILKFGTILHSTHFLEFVMELWEQKQSLYEQRRRYKKELKTDKDYNTICELLQNEKDKYANKTEKLYNECKEIELGHLENNSVYNKLKFDYKELTNKIYELKNQLENQDDLKQQLTDAIIEKSESEVKWKDFYKNKYEKDIKIKESEYTKKINDNNKECDKFKKEYVKQQDKIIFMEKNEEIKNLKNKVKMLSKQLIQSMN